MIFLDTNTCIYFLNGQHDSVAKRFACHIPEEIQIPAIVEAELRYGVEKSKFKKRNLEKLESFLYPFKIAHFGSKAAKIYGELRDKLEKKGKTLGPNDLIIAATVLAQHGTLITHNTKEFSQAEGLKLDDWVM